MPSVAQGHAQAALGRATRFRRELKLNTYEGLGSRFPFYRTIAERRLPMPSGISWRAGLGPTGRSTRRKLLGSPTRILPTRGPMIWPVSLRIHWWLLLFQACTSRGEVGDGFRGRWAVALARCSSLRVLVPSGRSCGGPFGLGCRPALSRTSGRPRYILDYFESEYKSPPQFRR